MFKFKHLVKEQYIFNLIEEFVNSQSQQYQLLSEVYSGLNTNSSVYSAIKLGEQTAHDIHVDVICEYLNDHPVLKEDIFQRGLARTKAYLTTPLGKGFGSAKNQQLAQNLINTFRKNTEKIVNAGPSQFAPSKEDVKNSPTQIGKVGALIGQRFAALQNNPKLNVQATPSEIQIGMGRIEQLIANLRSSGLVKGIDSVLDEIGIFARQHPSLTNMIVAGLVAVSTLSGGGSLFGIPMLGKFLTGTALRTLLGMLKGEKATQAATKGAMVSGSGIAIGKLLGLFYDKLAGWLMSQGDDSALSVPVKPTPTVARSEIDTRSLNPDISGVASNAAQSGAVETIAQGFTKATPQLVQQLANAGKQSGQSFSDILSQNDSFWQSKLEPALIKFLGSGPGSNINTDNIHDYLDTAQQKLTGPTLDAITKAINSVGGLPPETMSQHNINIGQSVTNESLNPHVVAQLTRKGALGALKPKFGLYENNAQAEVDYLKAELMLGAGATATLTEANPFTAAKNFMFGGPQVGGKNARLDYKQVESDYLKLLNNLETQFGVRSEKDILDMLKRYDKVFSGAYGYVKKVRDWLYGATPESNNPQPEPVVTPPQEVPTPTNPNPDPTNPTKPEDDPNKPTGPVPGQPPATLPGAITQLDANKIKVVKVFLSRLIDLGEALTRTNPNTLTKPALRDLATIVYNLGDVMVNKKTVGKVNSIVDRATQGLDLLGQPPETKAAKPVSNVFKEETVGSIAVYNNPELTKQITALKSNPVFTNLPQRLGVLMAAKYNDAASMNALRVFLTTVYNNIVKNSAAFQQSVGNPIAIKKELESDKEYLKEATSAEIQGFIVELNNAMVGITKLAGELRQAFNRKNPNNIYTTSQAKSGVAQQAGFKPKEKTLITLRVPPALKDTGGLLPKALYQYYGGKWNVITAKGLQPLDPKNAAKQIAKLTALAKDGRNDYDEAIKLMKTNSKDKGSGIDYAVGNQVKEYFNITDYKKFF
jgi:hypothetical protein